MVGLIRGVSEGLGPVGGAAMIYSLSGLLLIFTVGFPNLRQIPRRYLLAGSVLFVSYEICLALSLGFAATRQQAIEVGMVNYLWPSLTILFAILFNGQKSSWLVIPGLLLALFGVSWVLGGEHGLNLDEIINNVISSPLSYFLAFIGAFIWAAYCTVTAKYAKGKNGITLFVLLTALTLWLKFFASAQPPMLFSWPVVIKLITVSVALGLAYAAWNVGILHGNVSLLAAASYFTPVLSSALAAVLLSAALSWSFWQGAGMVCRLPALLVRHPPLAEIAARHWYRYAGDIAGLIAGEKQDRIRLFRQRAVTMHQAARHRLIDNLLIPRLFLLARQLIVARRQTRRRLRTARRDGVNPNTAAAVLHGNRASQRIHASLRRRIRHPVHPCRRHRRDIDDAAFPLFQHPGERRAAAPQGREQRAADLFLNLFWLILGERSRPDGAADVVDEHVEAAEMRDPGGKRLFSTLPLLKVSLQRQYLTSGLG